MARMNSDSEPKVGDTVKLDDGSLGTVTAETLVIDTRPWAGETVRMSDGAVATIASVALPPHDRSDEHADWEVFYLNGYLVTVRRPKAS